MTTRAQNEAQRLRMNIEAISYLLQLADRLRRTNMSKWRLSRADWLGAVQAVLKVPEGRSGESAAVTEAIRLAHKIVRRLGNSGEARLDSASVGRDPDSSLAGTRFYEDLEMARQRLAELQELESA